MTGEQIWPKISDKGDLKGLENIFGKNNIKKIWKSTLLLDAIVIWIGLRNVDDLPTNLLDIILNLECWLMDKEHILLLSDETK